MNINKLDIENISSYWRDEAKEALEVADHLFEKEDYSYALFFGHLALEKLLKALFIEKRKEHAPPIHNLFRLSKLADIQLNENQKGALMLVTSFNIEARYPNIQRSFRRKCTKEFTQTQMENIKELFAWLKTLKK
jgi:HEPN domain-containing protein